MSNSGQTMLRWVFRFIFFTTLLSFLALSFFLAFVHSDSGKSWITKKCIEIARNSGLKIRIECLTGSPPLRWSLRGVHIQINETDTLSIDRITVRISPFSLLKGEIDISYIRTSNLNYSFKEKTSSTGVLKINLPIGIHIRSALFDSCYIYNQNSNKTLAFSATGSVHKTRRNNTFSCKLKACELENPLKCINFSAQKKRKLFNSTLLINSDQLIHFIIPKFPISNLQAALHIKGPLSSMCQTDPLHVTGSLTYSLFKHSWNTEGSCSLFTDGSMHIDRLFIYNNLLTMESEGDLGIKGKIKQANISCHIKDISFFNPTYSGSAEIHANYAQNALLITCESPLIEIKKHALSNILCTIHSIRSQENWETTLDGSALDEESPIAIKSTATILPWTLCSFKELTITAKETKINGIGNLHLDPLSFEGSASAHTESLNTLTKWIPEANGKGSLDLHIDFLPHNAFTLLADLRQAELYSIAAQKARIEIAWPKGPASFEAEGARLSLGILSSVHLKTHKQENTWPFTLGAKGSWKSPLEIQISGSYTEENKASQLLIEHLEGICFNQVCALKNPACFRWNSEHFLALQGLVKLGPGLLEVSADISKETTCMHIHAERVPLDLLAAASNDITLEGTSSFDLSIKGPSEELEGQFNLILEQADISHLGKPDPMKAKGSIQCHLEKSTLHGCTYFQASGGQFIEASATIPLSLSFFPMQIQIEDTLPLSGQITMEGNIEEVFDFVHMGSHHVNGLLSCHLFLSKNLSAPAIVGSLDIQGGIYENYYTGTYLQKISAHILAEKDALTLTSLDAYDKKEGSLRATGKLLLNLQKNLPFEIEAQLEKLGCVHTDMISAEFSGPLRILGNRKSMQATGSLRVSHADCNIPDSLPSVIATLPVTYIHMPRLPGQGVNPQPVLFPLYLDLHLQAQDHIFVRGRGLESEWKGDVHLTGTNTSVGATGSYSLIKGDFLFSGKTFTLHQGEITLSDKPTQSAYLSLSGTLTLPDQMTITAQLRGPLSSPQLTFNSVPHQPTSSILSHILFNKDISEITPFQAIQLAQTVVTLSGGAGPNVLEAIRKTLGVDKLNIVSSPGNSADVSVQIGKYLTKGVMVSLTQSANSSNVIVEVELRPGLSFEAETQDQEEGKFSLKWHKHY